MANKFEEKILLKINYEGDLIEGYRIVTGKRIKYQKIYYRDIIEPDSLQYTKDRQKMMEINAKLILYQIIKRSH